MIGDGSQKYILNTHACICKMKPMKEEKYEQKLQELKKRSRWDKKLKYIMGIKITFICEFLRNPGKR